MELTKENKIVASICILFFIIIGSLFWKGPSLGQPSNQPINRDILVRSDSQMTGKQGAKVAVVEFGDYQCPACAMVDPELKKVVSEYKDNPDFNFVYRHFPLPQHKNAIIAAEAAESAGVQGKFFEMSKLLYENQTEWSENTKPTPLFSKYASVLGLNLTRFEADIKSEKFLPKIKSDLNDGQTVVIDHTPTVYINGTEQRDLRFEAMKQRIDELLTK